MARARTLSATLPMVGLRKPACWSGASARAQRMPSGATSSRVHRRSRVGTRLRSIGWVVSTWLYGLPSALFLSSVRDGINTDDILGGVIKPLVFALLMGTIACHKGLKTEGGTVGVGRSTTSAVVMASIVVIISDFFLPKALQVILGTT